MEFRPCIDIHNGKVKQIVGGSLKDRGDFASENFVSEQDSRFYADMYRKSGIKGGHIILLNSVDSEYYEDTKKQAVTGRWRHHRRQCDGVYRCRCSSSYCDILRI